MHRRVCMILMMLALLGVMPLEAQVIGTPASQFVVDQTAPDLATATGYVYRYYPDGAATGTIIAMTCTGTTSPFVCRGPIPAFTPGAHSVTFTAANVAGESPKSTALAFTFVVIPATPQNPRIQ